MKPARTQMHDDGKREYSLARCRYYIKLIYKEMEKMQMRNQNIENDLAKCDLFFAEEIHYLKLVEKKSRQND